MKFGLMVPTYSWETLDYDTNGLPLQLPLPFNRPHPSWIDDILAGT